MKIQQGTVWQRKTGTGVAVVIEVEETEVVYTAVWLNDVSVVTSWDILSMEYKDFVSFYAPKVRIK